MNKLANMNDKKILASCLGDCVHVAGILNFLQIAEKFNLSTKFLGPARKINEIISNIKNSDAKFIALSYRLTPDTGKILINDFIEEVRKNNLHDKTYLLGCLPELAIYAKKTNFFTAIFTGGESIDEILPIFNLNLNKDKIKNYENLNLIDRIKIKTPYPILRAHFGLSSFDKTIEGIKKIAEAKILDVISIAPDQACQAYLQHPELIKKQPQGSGGVPIRSIDDLNEIYRSSRRGNYPLLRIYSGTQDLVKNGEWFHDTLKNAWAAIPVFWYSELDGRGPKSLKNSIEEHFEAIKWHSKRDIPVEINDPHQWGLRMAPDHLVVADAYISAKIAKSLGVKNYIEQLMFNTPSGNSLKMDMARVLAMIDIVKPLESDSFSIIRESRTGLAYLAPDPEIAKGQLAASTLLQMAIKPQIMHVVSYCEADHAAEPKDIIESVKLIGKVIQDSISGIPDFLNDKSIIKRKNELISEAKTLINGIEVYAKSKNIDNWILNAGFLSEIVKLGILDADQLIGNPVAQGKIHSRIIGGKCVVTDDSDNIISEKQRLERFGIKVEESMNINLDFKNPIII